MSEPAHAETMASTPNAETPEALVAAFDQLLVEDQGARAEHARAAGELRTILAGFEDRARTAAEIRAKLATTHQTGLVDGRGWPGQTWRGVLVHEVTTLPSFRIDEPEWAR